MYNKLPGVELSGFCRKFLCAAYVPHAQLAVLRITPKIAKNSHIYTFELLHVVPSKYKKSFIV